MHMYQIMMNLLNSGCIMMIGTGEGEKGVYVFRLIFFFSDRDFNQLIIFLNYLLPSLQWIISLFQLSGSRSTDPLDNTPIIM